MSEGKKKGFLGNLLSGGGGGGGRFWATGGRGGTGRPKFRTY